MPPTPAPRKREESRLLAEIRLAIGARPDVLIARINTGVYAAPGNGARVRSAPNGFPDLICTQKRHVMVHIRRETNFQIYEKNVDHYYGQSIAIETKTLKGRLSEAQCAWRDQFTAVGGIYIVPTSVDHVIAVLGDVPEWITRS